MAKGIPYVDPDPFDIGSPHEDSDPKDTTSPISPTSPPATVSSQSVALATMPQPSRALTCWSASFFHYRFVSPDSTPLYYGQASSFKRNTPDVTLHSGNDNTGAILGMVKFRMSSDFRVGLGDHTVMGGSNVPWEDVKLQGSKWKHANYGWSMDMEMRKGNGMERKSYRWEKAKRKNWRCVDEESGEALATWVAYGLKPWKKLGEFGFMNGEMGQRWDIMALLVLLGNIEKARRRD